MKQESAHVVALEALGWLAAEPERLDAFLGASGLSPAQLRDSADDPEVLGAVLDHLLGDEAQVRAFCADMGLAPAAPLAARAALPGGDAPHWT